jgi:hypothetical protein
MVHSGEYSEGSRVSGTPLRNPLGICPGYATCRDLTRIPARKIV